MSQTSLPAPSGPPGLTDHRSIGAIALQPGRGRAIDEVMAMLAFIVLPLDFPAAEPIRWPVTLLLVVYIALRWREVAALAIRAKWFFLLPAFCLLSGLWADSPVAALRHTAFVALAMTVATTVATRLDHRQIAVAVLLSQGALAVASGATMTYQWSAGFDGGYSLVGVFPHKNILGQRMLFTLLAAVAIVAAPGYRLVWKPVAVALAACALFLILRAQSATAVLLMAGGVPLGLGFALGWSPAGGVSGLRSAMVCGAIGLVATALFLLVNVFGVDPLSDLLDAFGKDPTLTGRTEVWAAAAQAIAEDPLLGTGAGNFWRIENSQAVQLAQRFYNEGADFRFHNFYVETLVHLGAIGLALTLFVYGRGIWLVLRGELTKGPRIADPFFLSLMAVFVVRSMTESELFYPMVLGPILFWTLVFSAVRGTERERAPTPMA